MPTALPITSLAHAIRLSSYSVPTVVATKGSLDGRFLTSVIPNMRPMISLLGNWGNRLGIYKDSKLNDLNASAPSPTPATFIKSRRETVLFIFHLQTKI